MPYVIEKVISGKEVRAFHKLPFRIYKSYPNWRPPLYGQIENIFDRRKNPFFRHGECERFLVRDGRDVVGRFALMIDHKTAKRYQPPMGGLGFLEMEDDIGLLRAILHFAAEWHRQRGFWAMRGPVNFGENDNHWGLLVENYDDPPLFGMPYHPPYYKDLIEASGAGKWDDHYSYERRFDAPFPERMVRITDRLDGRDGITLRTITPDTIEQDAEYIRQIYNAAWSNQDIMERETEFTEITPEAMQKLAAELKQLILPNTSWIAFVHGEPASFIADFPDLNELLIKTGGRIRPWHLPRLIHFRKNVRRLRIMAFGTAPRYRKMGLDAFIFVKGIEGVRKHHPQIEQLEGAWISEKNWLMRRSVEALGCVHHKTHRTYRWVFG